MDTKIEIPHDINPRYYAYCLDHGAANIEEMKEKEENAVKEGSERIFFVIWIRRQWREWRALTGHSGNYTSTGDHTQFDKWLFGKLGYVI